MRVIADLDDRVQAESMRENIPSIKARMQLKHDDEEREKWALFLYGADITDPAHYDLTVNVSALGVEDSAELIAQAAKLPYFQATDDSRRSSTIRLWRLRLKRRFSIFLLPEYLPGRAGPTLM